MRASDDEIRASLTAAGESFEIETVVPATVWLAAEPSQRGPAGKLLRRAIQAEHVGAGT